jgi:hypothetical protein
VAPTKIRARIQCRVRAEAPAPHILCCVSPLLCVFKKDIFHLHNSPRRRAEEP